MDNRTDAFHEQAGAKLSRLVLAKHGTDGNGHMLMLEANNNKIADVINGFILADASAAEHRQQPIPLGDAGGVATRRVDAWKTNSRSVL